MTGMITPKKIKLLSLLFVNFSERGSDSVFIYDCFHGQGLSSVEGNFYVESLFNLEIVLVHL